MTTLRIGHGYDVHQLCTGRKLILGGVEIPFERGLLGHSDADVLIHAIMDSLLGAANQPNIGQLFPDNDNSYLDISSCQLLSRVMEILKENNYIIVNLDCTIIAQKPKINPYIKLMKEKVSSVLGINADQINIKATTEEKLGFTGQELGISAHAISLIEKKV